MVTPGADSILLGWIAPSPGGGTALHRPDGSVEDVALEPAVLQLDTAPPRDVVVPATVRRPTGHDEEVLVLPLPDGEPRALLLRRSDSREGSLENLVNQIAHDVRNFVFTMGLQTEMALRRAGTTSPEIARHLDAVLRQIDKLRAYLDTLLLYGRPARIDPAAVDPVALAREEVQRCRFARDAALPPATIHVSADDVGPVKWDARAVAAALRAVLDNALRSDDPAPPVEITLEGTAETVAITVRDTGKGIAPENVSLLFHPMAFRRAGGAGLGLAIARKLVEAHGGSLGLDTGPGGTTVEIVLPRESRSG